MRIVADNLTIVRSELAQALALQDPLPFRLLVGRCEQAGAQAIDINSGPMLRAPKEQMTFLVHTVRAATRLPIVLDCANPIALEAGLVASEAGRIAHADGRIAHAAPVVINGFSLEPVKLERILPLAARYSTEIIGYLLTADNRVPIGEEALFGVALELFEAYVKSGLPPERLIIDPVVVPLSWPDGLTHNRNVLSLIRRLPELLGEPVRTIAGLSNLTSGALPLSRKISLEKTYLPMLAAAGLNMALVNMEHRETVETAKLCDALLNSAVFA